MVPIQTTLTHRCTRTEVAPTHVLVALLADVGVECIVGMTQLAGSSRTTEAPLPTLNTCPSHNLVPLDAEQAH